MSSLLAADREPAFCRVERRAYAAGRDAGRDAGGGGRPRCTQRAGEGSTADSGQGTGSSAPQTCNGGAWFKCFQTYISRRTSKTCRTSSGRMGMMLCVPCGLGFYQEEKPHKSPECDTCPKGYFSPEVGALACIPCAKGKFGIRPKQKSADKCNACPRGYYAKYGGSKECDVCRSGFYNNQTSASICAECVSGRYLSSTTGTSCTICPLGYAAPNNGTSRCTGCPAGYFADATEQNECKPW